MLCSVALIGSDRLVGEQERPPFAPTNHRLDGVEQMTCGQIGIAELTHRVEIVPGDLEGLSDGVLQRLAHEQRTLSGATRSLD